MDRLDQRLLPKLTAVAVWVVDYWTRARKAPGSRLFHAALADTGLLGPAVVLVLITGCLIAATGGDISH